MQGQQGAQPPAARQEFPLLEFNQLGVQDKLSQEKYETIQLVLGFLMVPFQSLLCAGQG